MNIRICIVKNAGKPFEQNEDYSCFNCVRNKKGVYVFRHRDTGEVLYVGEAGAKSKNRNFKKRIQQHYGRGKTGGNFHINWRKENCPRCKGKKKCDRSERCNYGEYQNLLRVSRVIFLCCENAQSKEIDALENLIKFIFLPKFDGEVMKMRRGNIEYVTNLGNVIRRIIRNEPEPSMIEGHECVELNPEAASFQNSYILRIIAASVSPEGILANHPILKREELGAVRECLRTLALCEGDE